MPPTIAKEKFTPNVGRCVTGCRKAAFEGLEPCVGKLTSTVLMGLGRRNESWLPGELLINFVTVDKPKMLLRLEPKGT